ncbi:MAG TPA: response regulator [Terriglobales bacterium]|nr:response regulator [Terriglobales bacterium]
MRALVILCIDDNDSGLKIRKLLLESMGFRVLIARDGPTGLDIVSREHVDLIILDYAMPRMDGEEVAKRLRTQHPQIRILLLSGFRGSIPESLLSMVDGFIEKGKPAALLIAELERLTGARENPSDEQRRRA